MAFTSTTAQNYEQVSYRGGNLSMQRAAAREIIETAAAATLTQVQSGALVLMDAAAGFTITLPTAIQGMYFDFLQTITQTSGTQKIICASGAFILGYAAMVSQSAATAEAFTFDGSTHLAITMNGTTTGGYAGTKIRLTALSATVWGIESVIIGSGTLATPASTS